MLLGQNFERFVEESPISVMVRGVLENAFHPNQVDALFERTAESQYTRNLLFSSLTELMCQVVFDVSPSVRAAYQANSRTIGVSVTSVYNKLDGVESNVSAELVRDSVQRFAPLVGKMKATLPPLLPGFRTKILDGNHFSGTEHRIEELRTMRAGALPGHALVVLDPELKMATDVFPCEDGHTQERALLGDVLASVTPNDLWIADRNFCTTKFVFGLFEREGFFLIRQHTSTLYWEKLGKRQSQGKTATGKVYEQRVKLTDPGTGRTKTIRRITIELFEPTRDGDRVMHILTNVPARRATAVRMAELYRKRWTIETMFQELTETLTCEIKTLGYPKAAVFAFCLSLVAYNAIAVVKAAMRAAHGAEAVEKKVSGYYISLEISRTTTGMMIAIPAQEWTVFHNLSCSQMAKLLKALAAKIELSKYQKHPRGPKKPKPKKTSGAKIKHVSTARVLAKRTCKK
jgi:hypothetical protein